MSSEECKEIERKFFINISSFKMNANFEIFGNMKKMNKMNELF